MHYDPIKKLLGNVFNKSILLRKIFYKLLDILLLRTWHIKKYLRIIIPKNKTINILDAGSGYGQYSWFIANKYPLSSIDAIDIKQEQIDDCNNFFKKTNRLNVVFQNNDLTTYKKYSFYDIILCVDVMEHIENDKIVFSNFFHSLKDNGYLIISTPTNLNDHEHNENNKETFFVEEHVRDGYKYDEIFEKLKEAGFNNIKINYTYGKPGHISWLISMKIPMIVLNVSKIFFIILPFYYLLLFPICLILNYCDTIINHKHGTGLIVIAKK